MADKFPILSKNLKSVPWSFADRFRTSIEANHGQTLERLANRGGLSPGELMCAGCSQKLSYLITHKIKETTAMVWLDEALEIYGEHDNE